MIIDAKIIFDFYWIYFLSDNFVYKTHHSTPNLGQGTHSNVFKSVQMLQLTYFAVAVVCSFLVVHLWLCNMQQFMKNIWPSFKRASFPFFFFGLFIYEQNETKWQRLNKLTKCIVEIWTISYTIINFNSWFWPFFPLLLFSLRS